MSSTLKILFLTNRVPYPVVDGQSRRTYEILKGLAARHRVHLLSLWEHPREIEKTSIDHLRSICERVEYVACPPKQLSPGMLWRLARSLVSKQPYTIWRHYSSEFVRLVERALREGDFDIVHCDMPSLAYVLRRVSHERWTITDHDVSYLKAERLASNARNPLLRAFLRVEARKLKSLETNLLKFADLGVAVSDHDRRILNALAPDARMTTAENGVDIEAVRRDNASSAAGSLVWLGGFSHRPNVEAVQWFLQKVYAMVKDAFPSASLTVVGGDPPEWLREAARNDPTIRVTGFVHDPYTYLGRDAVFVAPILSGSGTKLKVIEAMGAGMAIVGTSVAAEGIEGVHGKHFLVADDPVGFARAVVSLLEDDAARGRLADAAFALAVDRYDWGSITARLSAAYCELASDRSEQLA